MKSPWVKASERLPEITSGYSVQIILRWRFVDNVQLRTTTNNQFIDMVKTGIPDLSKIDWINESIITQISEENERLRTALKRAIGTIESECDDLELIEQLKGELSS